MAETNKTGLGTAGMVLGIITAALGILCIIPFLNVIFGILMYITGTLAIIFGIIALCKGDKTKGLVAILTSLFGWFFVWILVAAILG